MGFRVTSPCKVQSREVQSKVIGTRIKKFIATYDYRYPTCHPTYNYQVGLREFLGLGVLLSHGFILTTPFSPNFHPKPGMSAGGSGGANVSHRKNLSANACGFEQGWLITRVLRGLGVQG